MEHDFDDAIRRPLLKWTRMRRASPDDVAQLVELMAEFYAEAGYDLNRRRAAEAFENILADERLGFVWFIQSGSADVGYLVLTLKNGMEYGGLMACLDDLFVRPSFRNRGLGTAALEEVRTFCDHMGVRAISVEVAPGNGTARAVYKRAGFTETVDRQLLMLRLAHPTHVNE